MRNLIPAALLVAGLAACGSTQDADHGVSNASYRDALQTMRDKVANLEKRLEASRDEDEALSKPFHAAAWWESQIAPAKEAVKLADATLAGTNSASVAK